MAGMFEGKVALVTGAGSGIGRATAQAFAREGAAVVVADVADEAAAETVALITADGGTASAVHADVSDPAQAEAMVAAAVSRYGGLDIAHNNAGIEGASASIVDYPIESWQHVIAINLSSVFYGLKHEIPAMLARGGGAIVNTASILGLVGFANAAAYTAAKHGVVGLTKVAALEVSGSGIRVNAVCPGFIETPMIMERGLAAGTNRGAYDQIAALHPAGRLGKAEEVAELVVWLASPAASFVTGGAYTVDGAYTAR